MGHGATRSLVLAGALAAAAAGGADAPPAAPPDAELLEFLGSVPDGGGAAGDWDLILDALGADATERPAPPPQGPAGSDGHDDAPPR